MKAFSCALLASILLAAPAAFPKDRPSYERGVLLSMDSSMCGTANKSGKTLAGEILGTDSSRQQTVQVLCQEYVLQSDHVIYRIRPADQKHAILLPVGDPVDFRIHKDRLYLMDPESDKKERQYIVLSMRPRSEANETQ